MLRKSFVGIGMWIILLVAVVVPQSLYAQCITPPSGMVAWWPLDETSGPTANDIAGSVNNSGTWISSPVPVTGKVAGALSFNGSNSVDVPDQAELNFGTSDFSIDLWIKTTNASGTRTILDKRTGSLPNVTGYALYLYNGYLGLNLSDGAGYTGWNSTAFVANGNWHHVAVTVDRDNTSGLLFYMDGSLVGTPFDPTGRQLTLTNTAPFVMARNLISPSYTFAGTLDELELFKRVLDSLEVRSIWTADSLGKCKTIDYGDITVTPLGNAIVAVVETTLVVSNIGSSGFDGMDAEMGSKDGDWAIMVANPDPSGTFPVGGALKTEFYFSTPSHPDSFNMGLSMTKAATNTWNLAVQSDASICSVKAFNNGSPVFSGVDIGTTGLGYVVESAKGVHPVGFQGGSTGKPASVVVSSGYDFTDSPVAVQWTWAAHGVSNLQIDYLSTSAEVAGTSLVGVTHVTMCGDNGAKTDPISFTILDIEVTPPFKHGDVNGDGLINLGDVVYLISYQYKNGPAPVPLLAGDVNCDGMVGLGDVVYLISYQYRNGPRPPC
jgi:hypothetical protein